MKEDFLLIASSDCALRTRIVRTLGREADLRSIREAPDRATAERLHAARAAEDDTRLRRLTQRERQISGLIAIGSSNKEIADRLSITERTVKAHLTNIFQKLQLSSRVHLAIHALQLNSPTKTKVQ